MPLTVAERKYRLPRGAQKEVAALLGVGPAYISRAMEGDLRPKTPEAIRRLRRAQRALAKKLGVTLTEAFPEAAA
jgi:transcriptional regulator with XRE-family HTH domain